MPKTSINRASTDLNPADTLDAARIIGKALAEAWPETDRLSLARTFVYRMVAAWWTELAGSDARNSLRPFLQRSAAFCQLPEPAAASANSIGSAAAAFEPEAAAYAIGQTYTAMLPPAYRASHGIFYTPPQLTARLIEQATTAGVDWTTARVLDPACGGGAFLAPVAKRILEALPDVTPAILVKNIGSRLRGFEIDPFAAWLSQVTLDAVMWPVCRKAGCRLPVVVTVCDSLQRKPPRERFDLVIGNPPYGRVTLSPGDRARFARGLYGHANLYGLFTELALSHARHGGVVAYVTPTSFLSGEYFKNLRVLIAAEAHPVTADFVASRKGVFEDVLQETMLTTYRKGAPSAPAQAFEVMPAQGRIEIAPAGTFSLPADLSQPWLLPRSPAQAALIERLQAMPHRLSDLGYGVSTGPLVWNRFKGQLRDRPGRDRFPLIWAEAITPDGRFTFKADKKNHQPYFAPSYPKDNWLITREPCVLLQRTTAKEQTRRLIAAALPAAFLAEHGAVVIENHLNMIRPVIAAPAVPPQVLAAILNSAAADRAFRCVNGSVAVSAYELESLPFPDPAAMKPLVELVRRRAARAKIEAECERIYSGGEVL